MGSNSNHSRILLLILNVNLLAPLSFDHLNRKPGSHDLRIAVAPSEPPGPRSGRMINPILGPSSSATLDTTSNTTRARASGQLGVVRVPRRRHTSTSSPLRRRAKPFLFYSSSPLSAPGGQRDGQQSILCEPPSRQAWSGDVPSLDAFTHDSTHRHRPISCALQLCFSRGGGTAPFRGAVALY